MTATSKSVSGAPGPVTPAASAAGVPASPAPVRTAAITIGNRKRYVAGPFSARCHTKATPDATSTESQRAREIGNEFLCIHRPQVTNCPNVRPVVPSATWRRRLRLISPFHGATWLASGGAVAPQTPTASSTADAALVILDLALKARWH